MPSETIVWTALPHGIMESNILVSVVVSPRLTDAGANHIGAFAEFAHWTQRVADAASKAFEIRWRAPGGQPGSAGSVECLAQELNPEVWERLVFTDREATVRPRSVRSLAETPIGSYPAGPGYAAIRKSYQDAAVSAVTGQPPGSSVDQMLDGLRVLHDAPSRADAVEWNSAGGARYRVHSPLAAVRVANERAGERRRHRADALDAFDGGGPVRISAFERIDSVFPGSATDRDTLALGQMLAYHQQAVLASHAAAERSLDAPSPPEFHELMTAIGGFPSLARRLGLIFELAVPLPPAGLGIGTQALLQVVPQWTPALTTAAITPWTALDVGSGWPIASTETHSKIDRGFLVSSPTGDGRLEAIPIDLASATLKLDLMSAGSGADRRLPALRSAGFSIARSGQAEIAHANHRRALHNDARTRAFDTSAGNDIDLYAEDLNRGYRIDVRRSGGGGWRSLHQLDRTFQSGDLHWTAQEEGFVQLSAIEATTPLPDGFPYLLMDESLGTWRGWGLSAPRPGTSLGSNGAIREATPELDLGGIVVQQTVTPGTLPRLRFGGRYRFRVRTVDLAGNARALADEPENDAAILPGPDDTLPCLRFEPLEPPVLAPRGMLGVGETIDRVVVRSAGNLAGHPFSPSDQPATTANQRHLIPGKTTQLTAELHGRFDSAFGSAASAVVTRAYEIARREGGTLAGSANDDPASAAVHPEAQVTLPYLPDPLGQGVALRNLPGAAPGQWGVIDAAGTLAFSPSSGLGDGNVALIPYGKRDDWPDLKPVRIQVDGSADARLPHWNAAERLLTVFLRPGAQYRIGLRTALEQDDLDQLGVWQWAQEELDTLSLGSGAPGDDPDLRARLASIGDYWFITPERSLTLVHAVQRPVRAPVLSHMVAGRPFAATFAKIENTISFDAASTARLDLEADWTDTIDPVNRSPYTVAKTNHVRAQQVNVFDGHDDWSLREISNAIWQQKSTYMLTVYGALENPGYPSAKPVSADGADVAPPPELRAPMQHEFSDTKHRMVTYTVTGSTRFGEYFPEALTQDPANITLPSTAVQLDIPSSANPAAPRVSSAVPVFRWRTPATPSLTQQRQRWGGIRIYLERPWYSSGEDERLAVVLWNGSSWPPDSSTAPFVTSWGRDPIWSSTSSLAQRPAPAMFPLRDPAFDGQTFPLPDLPGDAHTTVAIAAHRVTFPDESDSALTGLCWCDIQLDAGAAYTPFVRLAVARFQPSSIDGCHLSPVATTDFVQIVPHRSVTLASQGGNALSVTVAGEATAGGTTGNLIEVALEERIPSLPDEFGWSPVSAPISPAATLPPGTLWQGTVNLPTSAPVPRRLVVREYEQLPSDQAALDRRLVFADTIPLP